MSENYNSWAIVWHCLHDPMFSHWVQCRLVTNGQTCSHSIYHTGVASHGKNGSCSPWGWSESQWTVLPG